MPSIDTWDGVERRRNVRRTLDHCPLGGQCPVDELKRHVHKLQEDVAPVTTMNRLSQNKLLAGLCILLIAWVVNRLYTMPSSESIKEIRTKQQEILDDLATTQTFKALTTQRLDSIERMSLENNSMLREISQNLGARK